MVSSHYRSKKKSCEAIEASGFGIRFAIAAFLVLIAISPAFEQKAIAEGNDREDVITPVSKIFYTSSMGMFFVYERPDGSGGIQYFNTDYFSRVSYMVDGPTVLVWKDTGSSLVLRSVWVNRKELQEALNQRPIDVK